MRAAEMKERPGFSLMKQGDMQTIYHMQMPRWLFSDPRYAGMSLDAKVTYTFLLNRFQLSRRQRDGHSAGFAAPGYGHTPSRAARRELGRRAGRGDGLLSRTALYGGEHRHPI